MKRDEELQIIVKQILPNYMKTSLLANTVSSHIKKKERQDDYKKREISKNQHIPIYDYDHKFVYRQSYLRDDRVPAFISTK